MRSSQSESHPTSAYDGLHPNEVQVRIDASDVVRVARYDRVLPLPSTQRYVDVDDVVVPALGAHGPDNASCAKGENGDLHIRRPDEPGQANLPGATPGLRDDVRRNADRPAAPPRFRESGLHDRRFARTIEAEESARVEGKPEN